MTQLIRSEWIKATTTKAWWILFIVGAVLTVLSSLPILLVSSLDDGSDVALEFGLGDPAVLRNLWATAASAGLIALILGVLGFTGEYRHETITDTFLTEPRRGAVIASKSVVYALLAVLLAVVTSVVATVVNLLWLSPDPPTLIVGRVCGVDQQVPF